LRELRRWAWSGAAAFGWNLSGAYIIYAVFALISIGIIARFVRETDGTELESI
jgi:membrane protein implicated in regulation of membrane protease activity